MTCRELIKLFEQAFPSETALDFDNVGLLCGRFKKEVKKIFVALDATDEIIKEAITWQADMLITHHPLLLTPLKVINSGDGIGQKLIDLIQNDIACFALHTNYDVMRMADLASDVLGLHDGLVLEETIFLDGETRGIGKIAELPRFITLKECCELVKDAFILDNVKVFGDLDKDILRLAVSPGSGKSVIASAIKKGADVLVTGDIGHHDGIDALEKGLAVIDAGHYGTESIFIADIRDFLLNKNRNLEIKTARIKQPFQVR
ncbi:MAG: Nif3-like dinuclear metal center hexameric protein [Lachnospiraceae bacterium]|nr:Nif3-like dinuclear metal center hexameric protein [Lachnospiraceae bacterium]